MRPVAVEDRLVPRPLVGVGEHDQEQQRGIGRAVVGREGKEPETGELPIAELVRNLAGFLVLLGIVVGRLYAGKPVEGAEGELGKAADALHRDHQRVPPEERDVPGNAGRGNVNAAPNREVGHAERLHVGDRLSPDARQRGVAGGGELDRREHARRELRIPLLNGAAGEHAGALAIDHGQPLDAGVPALLGCEVDDELHPAVGKLRVRVFALDTHVQLALERAVGVGRAQLAGLLMPRALQVAAAHQALAPDVEDVGEVRLDGDLEDQADRMGRIADQVIVLVDAL